MDDWDDDFLALVEEAHLTFDGKSGGQIGFGASKDFLDIRYHAIRKGDAFGTRCITADVKEG